MNILEQVQKLSTRIALVLIQGMHDSPLLDRQVEGAGLDGMWLLQPCLREQKASIRGVVTHHHASPIDPCEDRPCMHHGGAKSEHQPVPLKLPLFSTHANIKTAT